MSQVDDSLKSARLVYRILMLLFATVLSINLYPSKEKDYSDAIAEIDAIVKIDLNQFINSSQKKLKSFAKGMDLVNAYQRAFDSAIRHELEQAGFLCPTDQSLNHEVFLPVFDENYVRSLLHTGTIENYRDFISVNIGVEYVFVQPEYLATAFVKKIHELDIPPDSKITGIKLVMSPPVYTRHKPKTFHLKMILILAVLKPNLGSYMLVVENPPVSLLDTFDETRFQDWLRNQQLLGRLVEGQLDDRREYTSESIFPHLRSVWSLLTDKVPEEAKRVLLTEVEKSRRIISFFGVEIDASMVVVAGPLLAVILFLCLLSYTGHLQRICQNNTDSLCTFPWLPLFPDIISFLVSIASILLLPIFTFIWLLVRFSHIGIISFCFAVLLTFASFILAYFSWHRINVLRKTFVKKTIRTRE